MAKGKKKSSDSKGRKITLKTAKNSVKLTVDGKRRLDLSNMEITTFPKCILKLCDVDELDLSRNMLKKLPDSIDRFLNLRWLDLHSNQLEQLPEAIGRLPKLLSLNLCNNLLTTHGIPHELGLLRNLRTLNLGLNRIETLPSSIAALKELQQLGLFNNLLTSTPLWLHSLPNLQKLNIKCNPIRPDEPPELDPIRRVECLYLVREGCLCGECLQKCKEKRGQMDSRLTKGPVHGRTILAGLITPNSVAQDDQARRSRTPGVMNDMLVPGLGAPSGTYAASGNWHRRAAVEPGVLALVFAVTEAFDWCLVWAWLLLQALPPPPCL
ncbi:hypothetical protein NFI96_001968 [Prochilodus magdalenae]|nr:hypothetical protein NFI96_001968 [Prochilodus magdalenae]